MGVRHRGVSQSVSQSVSNLFSAPDESVQVVILEYLRHQCLSEQGVGRATTREQGGSLEGECHMTGMTSKQTAI